MKYQDKSLKYFIDTLAAKTPTPGGGSVAATLGALGCGLLCMVANYTLSSKGFNGYKERAQKALKKSDDLRKKLTDLIDKDIIAYEALSKSFKANKDNPAKLQTSYKRAATPPFKMCGYIYKAALSALELSYVSTKYLISDLAVAINTLDAAFEAALVNVNINVKYIKDKKFIIEKTQICTELHKDIKRLKRQVLSNTRERMHS